ncbi:protein FAM200C-like [Diabrotica undecimpunctata]|uniref:protein FAM200C-like n=1 Tax=Diabrotica undecimpunctata TaxID=50387 RepID=UPI003B63F6FA
MKLDSTANVRVKNEKAVEASYKIALLIVKDKKPHTIGQSLIKPCLLTAYSTVLSKDSSKKVEKIYLSNDTTKRRIDDMALDLKNQLLQKLKGSPFFSLQCDETTDISKHAQLLFYYRFIDRNGSWKKYCFQHLLKQHRSGIMELAKKKTRIIGSHCIIHRQALASQTLPEPLNVTLNFKQLK